MIDRPPIRVREMIESDCNLIVNSWMRTYRGQAFRRGMLPEIYKTYQHAKVIHLLETTPVWVACDIEAEDHVFGWVCGHRPVMLTLNDGTPIEPGDAVIHWLWVKDAFRGHNVAKTLLQEFEPRRALFYTHEARVSVHGFVRRFGAIFNPYFSEGRFQ